MRKPNKIIFILLSLIIMAIPLLNNTYVFAADDYSINIQKSTSGAVQVGDIVDMTVTLVNNTDVTGTNETVEKVSIFTNLTTSNITYLELVDGSVKINGVPAVSGSTSPGGYRVANEKLTVYLENMAPGATHVITYSEKILEGSTKFSTSVSFTSYVAGTDTQRYGAAATTSTPVAERVYYDPNGGSGQLIHRYLDTNPSVLTIEEAGFSRAGYTFTGWNTAPDGSGDPYNAGDSVSGNMTLYAQWNMNPYTVTFDSNGGSLVPSQTVYHEDTAEQPANPVKTDYAFAGWYTDNETFQNVWDFNNLVTENITLYARWENNNNNYTVTFESNGGTAVEGQTVLHGATVTKPKDPIKEGYTFMGWYVDKNFETAWNFNADTVTEDITLYAKWGSNSSNNINNNESITPSTTPVPKTPFNAASAETGDRSIIWLWILLAIIGILGIFIVYRKFKKGDK